ncbi:MAG: hypothetical protein N3D11_12155 [Candidatus Sumerlaeia bacterium]|nr:hypothetical protein [Candidatus Sumerlaeia bacterium]
MKTSKLLFATLAFVFSQAFLPPLTPVLFAASAQLPKGFRAGAAKLDVTPRLGLSVPGNMSDQKGAHVHDPLHVRALVLDNGETSMAVVTCDCVALYDETIAAAKQIIQKQTGLAPDRVAVAATHSHSAGPTVSVFQSDADRDYLAFVSVRIADAVRCAANNRRPARIGWAVGSEPRAVFHRRFFMKPGTMPENPWGKTDDKVKMNPGVGNPNVVKPAGPTDPALPVVAVQDTDGDPIAVLANYTLHYVGGVGPNHISADYFGMWADMIEREWAAPPKVNKSPMVAMLTNGCSADINNVDVLGSASKTRPPYPYYQMDKVARMVADETLRVLRTIQFQDTVPLDARMSRIDLRVRKPAANDVNEAGAILEQAKGRELRGLREVYARETVLLAQYPDTMQVPVQALRIGDLGIVALPVEAFVELGLDIKKQSPFPTTFVVELCNGYFGYVPTVEGHELGGYETWRARSSYLEVNAAPALAAAALELLKGLKSPAK